MRRQSPSCSRKDGYVGSVFVQVLMFKLTYFGGEKSYYTVGMQKYLGLKEDV